MAWCIFALFSSSAFKIALAAVFVLDLFIQLSAAWFDGDLSASSSVSSTGDGSRSSSPGTHPNEATDDRVLLTAPTVHDSPTTSEGHLLSFHYAHSCDDLLLLFVARAVLFVVLGNLAVHRWRKIMESARDEIMVCEEVVVVEGRPVAGPGMVAAVMAGEKGEARELQNVVEGAAVAAVQGGGFDASLKEPLNGGARNGGVGLGGSRNGGDATSDDSTTSGSSASSVGAAARAVVCGTTATCGVGGVVSTSENEIKGITRVDGTAIKDLADPAAQLSTSSIVKKTAYIQLADKAELHKVVLVGAMFGKDDFIRDFLNDSGPVLFERRLFMCGLDASRVERVCGVRPLCGGSPLSRVRLRVRVERINRVCKLCRRYFCASCVVHDAERASTRYAVQRSADKVFCCPSRRGSIRAAL